MLFEAVLSRRKDSGRLGDAMHAAWIAAVPSAVVENPEWPGRERGS